MIVAGVGDVDTGKAISGMLPSSESADFGVTSRLPRVVDAAALLDELEPHSDGGYISVGGVILTKKPQFGELGDLRFLKSSSSSSIIVLCLRCRVVPDFSEEFCGLSDDIATSGAFTSANSCQVASAPSGVSSFHDRERRCIRSDPI